VWIFGGGIAGRRCPKFAFGGQSMAPLFPVLVFGYELFYLQAIFLNYLFNFQKSKLNYYTFGKEFLIILIFVRLLTCW
jgi:hypothetical protein